MPTTHSLNPPPSDAVDRRRSPTRSEPSRRAWITWVTWAAILAPVPYSLSRLAWSLGIPLGFNRDGLDAMGVPGWASFYVLGLAASSETVGLLTHRFMHHDHPGLPDWVPVLGGKDVPPLAVIVPAALIATTLLMIAFIAESPLDQLTDPAQFRRAVDPEGWMPGWAFWGQQAVFMAWGLSLATATITYHLRIRQRRNGSLR